MRLPAGRMRVLFLRAWGPQKKYFVLGPTEFRAVCIFLVILFRDGPLTLTPASATHGRGRRRAGAGGGGAQAGGQRPLCKGRIPQGGRRVH
eukprot:scaffold20646_cov101-Isochrysis_galbana.AAC.2